MKKEDQIRKNKIIEYINSKEYTKMTAKQIAVIFGIPKEEYKVYEKILNSIEKDGYIYYDDSKRICKVDNVNIFACKYETKSRSFGFGRIIENDSNISSLNDDKDIYISRENSNGSYNNDIVLVKIVARPEGKNKEGKVLKIISRADENIAGIFQKSNNFGFVIPINPAIEDIYIPANKCYGLDDQDRVLVRIIKYPTINRKAEGKVIEVIGKKSDEDIDRTTILAGYNVSSQFSDNVLKEAQFVSNFDVVDCLDGRIDFRKNRIYTIDSEDAKDLDDAVIVNEDKNGNYVLSVHIADVSHYVKPYSELDKEAIKRGTSIYTPGKVIPMLPKELSNGICSLNAGEDRLTLAVDIVYDKKGNILDNRIYKSVINVTKKMSYEKVQAVLDRSDRTVLYEYMDYIKDIELMAELARILKARREKEGSINFDLPETKIILDEKGDVVDVKPYEVGFSNNIIEEFMLAANKVIAETFYHLEAPFIYRIHEEPDIEKLKELNEVLGNMGMTIKGINNKIHPKALADIVLEAENTGDKKKQVVISSLVLRSLKLAKYSEDCLGHFGLAFKYYCHFTSPIRRYPDLFIHRVISLYIDSGYLPDESVLNKLYKNAREFAITSTEREKTATEIEREFDDLYKAKYMKKHLGDVYEGMVSGITKFGMYIKLENTVEGLVTLASLSDDYYIYDEKNMKLIGERTNRVYDVGTKVMVQVVRADEQMHQIDFELVVDLDEENKKY